MPKQNKRLTDKQVSNAERRDEAYKLYDTDRLHLLIRPTGKKVWQYPYCMHGKHNIYTITLLFSTYIILAKPNSEWFEGFMQFLLYGVALWVFGWVVRYTLSGKNAIKPSASP